MWTGDVQDEIGTGDSISKYDISFQDEWYCEVRSFDGIDYSEAVNLRQYWSIKIAILKVVICLYRVWTLYSSKVEYL